MNRAPDADGAVTPVEPPDLLQYWRLAETAFQTGTWQWNLRTGEIMCSAAGASLLGLPKTDAVNRDRLVACFDPADQERVGNALDEAADGQGIAVDAGRTEAEGTVHRLRLVATVPRDHAGRPDRVLGLVIPTDQQNRSHEASHLLAAIVASSDDAIISKTPDGIVTSWNQAAERIFGYRADEIIGKPIALLAVPGHESEMPAILERLRRGEKVDHYETTRRHKSGKVLNISLTVSPIYDEDGHFVGASKTARDITADRQTADALRDARERLQEQQAELLHAARLGELGQMVAAIAHEVNQPLTAINMYLRAGRRLLASPEAANPGKLDVAINKAAEQAVRASEIIRGLRNLSKRSDSDPEPVSVAPLIEEAVALATLDAPRRGVRIQLDLDRSVSLVLADRVQIQQVLMNLIRNALEAMGDQARRELKVTVAPRDSAVEVRVADTGPGLPPQVAEKLFQPFVTTKDSGMGIGLSVCKRIVEAHGGRLWAESNPGGGTVFAFALRLALGG